MLRPLLAAVVVALFSAIWCIPTQAANVYTPSGSLLAGTDTLPHINFTAIRKVNCGGGHGTGFRISPDTIVTAYHVVANSRCTDSETGENLKVIYGDPKADVAILHTVGKHPQYLKYSCDAFVDGESYYSIGYAGVGAENILVTHLHAINHYEDGSDTHGVAYKHMRALAGVIIPGMSGGPIIDSRGRVFGINNLTQNGFRFGLSREIRDLYLCARQP